MQYLFATRVLLHCQCPFVAHACKNARMEEGQTSHKDQPRVVPPDASDEAVGRRLRDAREAKGLTQAQVSTQTRMNDPEEKGVSRTALIGYEAGSSRPGTRELRLLCETLLVTPSFLIYGSDHPFQTAHAAMEGLRGAQSIQDALQVAFLVMVLKDHEKDALLSLILSLAGHHLGDRRVSGLRGMAMLLGPHVRREFRRYFKDLSDREFDLLPVDEVAKRLSLQLDMNIGNRLKFDQDGDIVGGEQTYPDPDG